MSYSQAPPRRTRTPSQRRDSEYISVPHAPYSPPRGRNGPVPPIRTTMPQPVRHGSSSVNRQNSYQQRNPNLNTTAADVQNHTLGGGFGPYAPQVTQGIRPGPRVTKSWRGHDRSQSSGSSIPEKAVTAKDPYTSAAPKAAVIPSGPVWNDKDEIDPLHDPDPIRDEQLDQECDPFSFRGWANMTTIVILCLGLIILFAGYPVITWLMRYNNRIILGYNMGGINGSGQVPSLPNLPGLIDPETPQSARTRTGSDGKSYTLVFSDEFNREGRTFWPGDDPWWEAVDLHYWATADLEWYTPDAITTSGGNLVITMLETPNHNLNFQSGMLQSWNKFCFSSGYIEVNVSLPGSHTTPGFWPGAWTMGNLGRAGYGASTEGMWPYSYDSCDVGTFPSQQYANGTPTSQQTLGTPDTIFSSLPGQKLSSCTCPGSDHPGPKVTDGRGVPEIDIIEGQIEPKTWQGEASQSFQVAPFNAFYQFDNTSTKMFSASGSHYNSYKGGPYQQAVSVVSDLPNEAYGGNQFATYAFEYWGNKNDRQNSYITWYINGVKTWTTPPGSVGPDAVTGISQRLISEEPMYIILNLGMANNFQKPDYAHLQFPASLLVDYIRVYQRDKSVNIGCDPDAYPTTHYISEHLPAYTNPNFTTWSQAGYSFPRNSLYDGC
ncbi:beta-glucan synthesis-associated protein-domain-containing protein [Cantharellus anzutake]|uniref:beta-glucan synthesis-associated protein-domain-containing protein n=1 Tax=Cantharellus anzutake TaxID=1750568 RepID=UPI0019034C7F|nr:beta-glucan synthesis-associated protein-domain-containing protein [Cantharellus anzutake]KAF8339600.1 beta-glucan synthesis-associated protein-domain-containing protein [Cantharellus anzutake]